MQNSNLFGLLPAIGTDQKARIVRGAKTRKEFPEIRGVHFGPAAAVLCKLQQIEIALIRGARRRVLEMTFAAAEGVTAAG